MTPMHQPATETKRVNHAITLDATDVEITRFVEYMEHEWATEWNNLLQVSNMTYDLGHDVLMFTTDSMKISLIKFITKISGKFK
jgi:hypothetical protein